MDEFKTIKDTASAQIIEKKSKFIANIFYVEKKEQAEECLKRIKKKYYDAKHNCFAYIIMDENGQKFKKSSDDGEPSGTAGAPMLEVLEKQNLCNVLVIVTRYFGGVLLGTGGLQRAYTLVTIEALKNVSFVNKTIGFEVKLEISYKNLEEIKYNLEKENIKIKNTNYGENVELIVEIPENKKDKILEKNSEKIIKTQIETKKFIDI